jgi:peptide/nickel transport system substrate-binding protein
MGAGSVGRAGDPLARAASRRTFLRWCAAASGALTPVIARGLRGTPDALAQTAPKRGGTLRVGFYIEAATMDPHLSGSKIDRQVYHNLYEPLLVLDVKLGLQPGLAESWTQPDPKTLVFKLQRGVKFHDGTDFNAEAAKFNFNRMKTDPKSVRKGETANIESVDVVDSHTIRLNLRRPDASLIAALTDRAGMMVSPKVVQERGLDLERNARGAGTGPFEFVEWVKDDHILLKRNENYWNKQAGPYLDQIRYRPIPDDTVKLASLQSGEIEVMDYVQPRDVKAVKADKNAVVVDVPSLASFGYQLNHTKPPFNNKALRQAVVYALDIDQIVKGVWLGVGVPSNGPIPPSSWAYDSGIPAVKRDLAKAKAKLAEGGQPSGLTFSVTTNNIPINVQEAEVMQAQLAEAGITMKIKLVDSAALLSDGNNKNFEMISYQWSGRPDPDGNTFQFFKTAQGISLNWSGISNPRIDALLDKSREVSDRNERKKIFSELTRLLHEELPMVFIVHPIEPKAFNPRVQGYEPIPDGMMRFKSVWLK